MEDGKLSVLRDEIQLGLSDATEGQLSGRSVRDIADEVLAGHGR